MHELQVGRCGSLIQARLAPSQAYGVAVPAALQQVFSPNAGNFVVLHDCEQAEQNASHAWAVALRQKCQL
jgi:hypothetical protein